MGLRKGMGEVAVTRRPTADMIVIEASLRRWYLNRGGKNEEAPAMWNWGGGRRFADRENGTGKGPGAGKPLAWKRNSKQPRVARSPKEQRQCFSPQLALTHWQEEQMYLNMYPAGPHFILHLMWNNFLSITDTSVKPNGISLWLKGKGQTSLHILWSWEWWWKNRWFSCWEINFQGEKNMSFEFIPESTKLCFLSQTHHTPGTSRYQILASFRNLHWTGIAQW